MDALRRFMEVSRKVFCRHEWNVARSDSAEHVGGTTGRAWTDCRKCGETVLVTAQLAAKDAALEVRLNARSAMASNLRGECRKRDTQWWRFL